MPCTVGVTDGLGSGTVGALTGQAIDEVFAWTGATGSSDALANTLLVEYSFVTAWAARGGETFNQALGEIG